jgi:hypothetical protein
MSSYLEIIDAVLAFYQQVIRHPYLDDAALKIPPTSGWDSIKSADLRNSGKSEAVIELLKHLPYLESMGQYERLLVQYETVPTAWTQRSYVAMEQVNPLPAHCIYLTEGLDREGYSLILDVEEGAYTMAHNETRAADSSARQVRSRRTALPATRSANPMRSTKASRSMRSGKRIAHCPQQSSWKSGLRNTPGLSIC